MDSHLQQEGGIFHWWKKIKNNRKILPVIWFFGHIVGIYTIDEYIYLGKRIINEKGIRRAWHQIKRRKIGNLRGLSIENFSLIGDGLILPHGVNITINNRATIGAHCTIYQGVTVGVIANGKRKGEPCIGDNVVLGPNAVVVGGINVGDGAVIAGNAFVNFDVPADAIVIGNPGIIHKKTKREID